MEIAAIESAIQRNPGNNYGMKVLFGLMELRYKNEKRIYGRYLKRKEE